MPPIFLGAGWFVLLRGVGEGFALAPAVVVTINGLMALPYTLRILGPAHAIQAGTPPENILALFETARSFYPH